MARMLQNNFSGGCLSPSLYGRSDLQSYYKGCANAENFLVAKEGSIRKRHGLSSVLNLGTDYDTNGKIFPYRYDRSVAGFLNIRRTTPGGSEVAITLYSKGGAALDTITVDDFAGSIKDLQSKQIGDQVWVSNADWFRLIDIHADDDAGDVTLSIESVSEWKQASQPSTIPHDDNLTAKSTHWSIHRSTNRSGKTIAYGIITVKDSVNSSTSRGECKWSNSWVSGDYIDVRLFVDIADLSKWDSVIVTKRQGGTFGELTRHYMDDIPDHYFDEDMTELYAWSDGTYRNHEEGGEGSEVAVIGTVKYYGFDFHDDNIAPGEAVYGQTNVLGEGFSTPLCVDCFQQRRVFANGQTDSGALPMTLWFSEVGNINNFYADRPSDASDSFSPTIYSIGPAFIRWIVSYDEMLVLLTDSGLYSVGFSQTSGFSAESCRISHFSDLAVSPTVQPVVTDAGIVFVAADNKTVYTVSYDLNENKLKPINRSVLVEHLTRKSAIKAIALQTSPDNIVWVITENGRYSAFTFEKNEEVFAWSDGLINGANIVDVISLGSVSDPAGERTYSDMVFVVERGGSYYACVQNATWRDVIGDYTAAVDAKLVTLRPESQERSIVGMTKNIKDILVRVYETGALSVVPTSGQGVLDIVSCTLPSDTFTGDIKVMPRGYINENGQLTFLCNGNHPCEILQIVTELEVN